VNTVGAPRRNTRHTPDARRQPPTLSIVSQRKVSPPTSSRGIASNAKYDRANAKAKAKAAPIHHSFSERPPAGRYRPAGGVDDEQSGNDRQAVSGRNGSLRSMIEQEQVSDCQHPQGQGEVANEQPQRLTPTVTIKKPNHRELGDRRRGRCSCW
jgi:hypothetical protein